MAQNVRPTLYHCLTDTSSYHVVAVDFRGFGHSTGVPGEKGLIEDASAVVEWATKVAGISASRIVLVGHSLGTAVVCGVSEAYTEKNVEFAGIVLVAGFSDLSTMLSKYRIGGVIPVLAPFRSFSPLLRLLHRCIVDKWHSADRLTKIVRNTKGRLRLSLVHSKNDRDIPWTEDNKLFKAAVVSKVEEMDNGKFKAWKDEITLHGGKDAFVTTFETEPDIVIRQELFPHGGKPPYV